MLYIAAGLAIYIVVTLAAMHLSIAAGVVLLALGMILGGAAAASIAG